MRITFQIVQAYSKQSIPSIVLNFETGKYFFNIPEPFQRLSKDHYVKFVRGSKIFVTQMTTDHISGLFGFLLTLFEGKSALNTQLYGPPGFSNYLNNNRFLFGYRILSYSAYDFFNSNNKLLGVKSPVFLENLVASKDYNHIFNSINDYLTQKQKENPDNINDAESFVKEGKYYKDENIEIHPLFLMPDSSSGKPCISYICKPNKIKGKVIPEKLKELNVPKNFIAAILEAKELMVHGVLYRARDFQEPDEPSPVLIIIDCPSTEYIQSLINQELLTEYFEKKNQDEVKVKAIVHMAPIDVLLNLKYQELIHKFDKSCQHIFINENLRQKEVKIDLKEDLNEEKKEEEEKKINDYEIKNKISLEGKSNRMIYRHFLLINLLAKYFPSNFPVLNEIKGQEKYDIDEIFPEIPFKSLCPARMEFVISAQKQSGFQKVRAYEKDTILTNFIEGEKFSNKYKNLISAEKSNMKMIPTQKDILSMFRNCDPELVFLGTASMMPSAYRNVSGIYLRFWQQGDIGFILDCGEGTYFQLLHHYGPQKTRELLKNLSVIFITHLHADHHLGFMKIITERKKVLDEENIKKDPVFLVIPKILAPWISKYAAVEDLQYRVVFNQDINIKKNDLVLNQNKQLKTEESCHHRDRNLNLDELEFEEHEDPDENKIVSNIRDESLKNLSIFKEFLLEKVGVKNFATVDVNHCMQACGVLIEHTDGWKFVYSGDTKPSKRMIEGFGKVTILVHEATFTHDQVKLSEKKGHSTDQQAIEVGIAMQAWRTVLTHFSQRFAKSLNSNRTSERMKEMESAKKRNKSQEQGPNNEYKILNTSNEEKPEIEKIKDKTNPLYIYQKYNTVRACDHLKFKFSELDHLPAISRCLSHMFPEDF